MVTQSHRRNYRAPPNILARVGRRLIAAARDWTRSRGIRDLEVSAWSFNLETIAFYKRVGFEPTLARFAMAVT